jgi:hypothetical protein
VPFTIPAIPPIRPVAAIPIIPLRADTEPADPMRGMDHDDVTSTTNVSFDAATNAGDEPATDARIKAESHDTAPSGEPISAPATPAVEASAPAGRPMPKLPISTAPDSLPPPKAADEDEQQDGPACPQCESAMGWVDEHLRFYCKSCRMYF